jgi:hypothetical protein
MVTRRADAYICAKGLKLVGLGWVPRQKVRPNKC